MYTRAEAKKYDHILYDTMFCVKKWNQSHTRILNRPPAHDKIKEIAIFSTTLNENWTSVLCINEIYILYTMCKCLFY